MIISSNPPLPEDWNYDNLESILVNIVDNRGKNPPFSEEGIPFIATNCIHKKNNRLFPFFSNIRYVSEETYNNWFRDHPKPFDIILVNKGEYRGKSALIPDPIDFCFAQDMVAIRADENIVDQKYLFAFIRSDFFLKQVESLTVGSLIPHFKKGDFKNLLVPIPPITIQKFIGKVFYFINYKIEINLRVNKILEAISQALFQNWFLDFEPFQDGEFKESELLKGWEIGKKMKFKNLDFDFVDSYRGKNYPKNHEFIDFSNYLFIDTKCLIDNRIEFSEAKYITKNKFEEINKSKLEPYDIVMSTRGTLGRLGYFNGKNHENIGINAQMIIFRAKREKLNPYFLYYYRQLQKAYEINSF